MSKRRGASTRFALERTIEDGLDITVYPFNGQWWFRIDERGLGAYDSCTGSRFDRGAPTREDAYRQAKDWLTTWRERRRERQKDALHEFLIGLGFPDADRGLTEIVYTEAKRLRAANPDMPYHMATLAIIEKAAEIARRIEAERNGGR